MSTAIERALASPNVPELAATAGERAGMRFLKFFASNIRNPHPRRVYARAADEFLACCAAGRRRVVDPSGTSGAFVGPDCAQLHRSEARYWHFAN